MRTITKIAVAATGAAPSSIVAIVPAQANQSWNVGGTLNTSGSLIQHSIRVGLDQTVTVGTNQTVTKKPHTPHDHDVLVRG